MGTESPLRCSAGVNGRFLSLPPSLHPSLSTPSLPPPCFSVTMQKSPSRINFAAVPKETSGVLSKSVAQLSKSAAQLSKAGRRKATVDTASPQC